MIFVVLALWWVVLPIVPELTGLRWFAHVGSVAVMGLLCVPSVWRRARLPLTVPAACTLAALLSLAVAMHVAPGRFSLGERWWNGITGAAHALLFLLWLQLVPRRAASGPPGGSPADLVRDVEPGLDDEDAAARRFRQLLAVLFAGVLVAQLAIVLRRDLDSQRIEGSLGNPNTLGAVVAALGLALAAFFRWRRAVLVVLSALVLAIVATRSRGAAAAATSVVLVFVARRNLRAALGLGAGLLLVLVAVPNPLWDRVLELHSEHHYSRPFLWGAALQGIAVEPLGIGPGMNRHVFPALAMHPAQPWLLHQRHAVGLTHNVFLTLTLEWGWLAGAAALVLTGWTALQLLTSERRDALGQGCTLGALVLFLELQIDGLEQNAVAFALFLVLAATALARVRCKRRAPSQPGSAERGLGGIALPGPLVALVLAGSCAFLLVQCGVRLQQGLAFQRAEELGASWALGEADEAAVRSAWEEACERAPRDAPVAAAALGFEAAALERARDAGLSGAALASRAASVYERSVAVGRLDPADRDVARARVDAALWWKSQAGGGEAALALALQALDALLALDPLDVVARRVQARELGQAGRTQEMEAAYAALFAIEPDDGLAWATLARQRQAGGDDQGALYACLRAREAVFNCRIKLGVDAPRSQQYYQEILERVDLALLRRQIFHLRRTLYL